MSTGLRDGLVLAAGLLLVAAALLDAFVVVLVPRPIRHLKHGNRRFFRAGWAVWRFLGLRITSPAYREDWLGAFAPFSMILLFSLWIICLITGFGLIQWALHPMATDGRTITLVQAIVLSGDSFFTLGYGDIVPAGDVARLLIIVSAGIGFGFIALTIGYLPVLYQHFSQQDVQMIELEARAGQPACAVTLFLRHGAGDDLQPLETWLHDWERWSAQLIESHATYPILAYYRSQHEGHSWLASLALVLDCCTLVIAGTDGNNLLQPRATFSAARRALDEIAAALGVRPQSGQCRALSPDDQQRLERALARGAVRWHGGRRTHALMNLLRRTYEPQLLALSDRLALPLPQWLPPPAVLSAPTMGKEQCVRQLLHEVPERELDDVLQMPGPSGPRAAPSPASSPAATPAASSPAAPSAVASSTASSSTASSTVPPSPATPSFPPGMPP